MLLSETTFPPYPLSVVSGQVITLPLSSLIRPREVGERSQSLSIGRGSKLRETDETHGVR